MCRSSGVAGVLDVQEKWSAGDAPPRSKESDVVRSRVQSPIFSLLQPRAFGCRVPELLTPELLNSCNT
jgi:hypothetical protein